jgi:hypothetical protein
MSPAGFEIDDEPVVRFVVGAVAAPAGRAWLGAGVNMPLYLVFEVKR